MWRECRCYCRAMLLALSLVLPVWAASLPAPQEVSIPLPGGGLFGSTLDMPALLYRPAGDGPFPVLLFSHGRAGSTQERHQLKHPLGRSQIAYWLAKGFIIVAPTDEEALAIARRTYPKWHANFHYLFAMHGKSPVFGQRAPEFDQIKDGGRGIAGSPASITRMLKEQLGGSGANYFVGQFAFGDLSTEEITRTVDLFVNDVMPNFSRGFYPLV